MLVDCIDHNLQWRRAGYLQQYGYGFLADRTNSHAYATVLRLSSVTWSIVAKQCILEQKLLLTAYRK